VKSGNRRTAGQMAAVGLIASAIGITAALLVHWFPPAASKQAGPIDTLWNVLLIVSIPVFVIVATVVLFSVKLFRVRPGQELEDGAPIHGNTRLEVIWTAIPSILIAALVVYAYLVLHDIEKAPANPTQELRVHVIAQQFAWQFEYQAPGGKTVKSDFLRLPKDRSVKFDIVTKDVLHDFWVPAFRMKIDTVPGITTHYRVTPTKLGNYPVVCAELCGAGHAFMRSYATVVTPQAFDAWLSKQAGGAGAAAAGGGGQAAGGGQTAQAADPKTLFMKGNGTSAACGSCHTLAAAGATGTVGPDLGKVLKGKPAAFIRESIVTPNKQIAPGFQPNIMPQDFSKTLSPAELTALVNYLVKVAAK
jgi:cytochrome c oxidase subunit 2